MNNKSLLIKNIIEMIKENKINIKVGSQLIDKLQQQKHAVDLNSINNSTIKIEQEESIDPTLLYDRTNNLLINIFQKLFKLSSSQINTKMSFEEYGINSIVVTQFNTEIEQKLGSLSKTLLYEYQSIDELTNYLVNTYKSNLSVLFELNKNKIIIKRKDVFDKKHEKLKSFKETHKNIPYYAMNEEASNITDIAIIGLSGRYPMSNDLDAFWENLKNGKDCITEIPKDRWNYELFYDPDPRKVIFGKMYCKWGGFIDDADKFDPLFFNISPKDAETMDPQERIFLEAAWSALEDAGYLRKDLWGNSDINKNIKVGVFAGITTYNYHLFGPEEWIKGNMIAPNLSPWSLANRVSYVLNLSGPSMPIDTACSSSLTAIHLACKSIKDGESNLAIAGGVNLMFHHSKYTGLCMVGMMSLKGRCHSFGENADGYVPGEGVGAVLLKPLSKAVEDRDHIYAVIKGTSINHGGRTSGFTVPNPNAQAILIEEALKAAHIEPRTISYIEAHGTGTMLGDPIEITGLKKAFDNLSKKGMLDKQYCSIGSAKSNIGHLESAAGIAGLTKIILQMKYKQLVPSIHAEKINPNINFKNTPFYVQQNLAEWKQPVIIENGRERKYPRRAGLSSFGAGGANAHAIIEEYESLEKEPDINDSLSYIIILSAKDEEILKTYAKNLALYIEKSIRMQSNTMNVSDIFVNELLKIVSDIIDVKVEDISIDDDMNEYGFDQIKYVELINKINEKYKIEISSEIFNEHKSIKSLSSYLTNEYQDVVAHYLNELKGQKIGSIANAHISLLNIAYTLQIGREPMEERLAIIVQTKQELLEKLSAYTEGMSTIEGLYRGSIKKDKDKFNILSNDDDMREIIAKWIHKEKYGKIVELWIAGVDIDWRLLYSDFKPSRVSLPIYPFSRERYWLALSTTNMNVSNNVKGTVAMLHPLIDTNESTLEEQCFKKMLHKEDYYVKDCVVKGERMLPCALYLEMARVAGNLAKKGLQVQRIKDIVWPEPLVISDNPIPISISLYPHEGMVGYEITTQSDNNKELLHSQGKLVCAEAAQSEAELIDIESVKNRCSKRLDAVEFYAQFQSIGLEYGLGLQSIQELYYNEHEAIARLTLSEQYNNDLQIFMLSPALMDSALQSVLILIENKSQGVYMPYALEDIEILKPLSKECYVYTSLAEESMSLGEVKKFNVLITNESGEVLVRLKNIEYNELDIQHEEKIAVPDQNVVPLKDEIFYVLKKTWNESEGVKQNLEEIPGTMIFLINEETRGIAEKLLEGYNNIKGIMIQNGLGYEKRSNNDYLIQLDNIEYGTKVGKEILESVEKLVAFIDLSDLERERREEIRGCMGRISLLQELIKDIRHVPFNIIHVTQGLQVFKATDTSISGAEIAGLIQILGAEYKKVQSKTIDIDISLDHIDEISDIIRHELTIQYDKGEICYREGKRYMPQMQELYSEDKKQINVQQDSDAIKIDPEKVIVITGGVRGIGFEMAKHFVNKGAQKLVLMGIQKLPDHQDWEKILSDPGYDKGVKSKIKGIKSIEDKGIRVEVYTGSLVDYERLNEFFTNIRKDMGDICGVVHCAGIVKKDNPAFINKESKEIEEVYEPKVRALEVLHRIFEKDKLEFFILFSSVSALIPALGSGVSVYGAANAFMDYFAQYQFSRGNRYYKSFNWPNWKEGGMGVAASIIYNQLGLTVHSTMDGLMMLDKALSYKDEATLMPCLVDKKLFKSDLLLLARQDQAQWTQLMPKMTNRKKINLNDKNIDPATKEWLTEVFSTELKIPRNKLDGDKNLGEFGVDSILIASLVVKIDQKLGDNIDPSIFLEYQTLNQLSQYIYQTYVLKNGDKKDDNASPNQKQVKKPGIYRYKNKEGIPLNRESSQMRFISHEETDVASRQQKVAVIGIACHFPGARNKDEFWENLASGKNSIIEVPKSRWDVNKVYSPTKQKWKSMSKWGGFIDNIDYFDPVYFNIKETSAPQVDPLIRQFLEVSVETLRDAGYEKEELWNKKVGVFVGSRMGNYGAGMLNSLQDAVAGTAQNFIAANVSHFFNFKGPNMVVDSACSSSLVSINLACQSLMVRESEYALAGGVDILLNEMPYIALSEGGALSPDGKCHTFDEKANGFVPGEGCGVVLLKRLDDAIRDGDHIYTIIEASSVNNDGHTMGITTPNPDAQRDVILAALKRGNIDPGSITYIEAHGTGTMIGDPIELRALSRVFEQFTEEKNFCAIGSVKTNVGHLLSAAGIVSFIKVALSLYNKKLVPTLHCETPNPRFEFGNSPFYPNTVLKDWEKRNGVRRAGISSFGFGGTNAHIIVCDFDSMMITDYQRKRMSLPPIEFKRKRYWLDNKMLFQNPLNDNSNGGNGSYKGDEKLTNEFHDYFEIIEIKRKDNSEGVRS